ncbi:hypothetical protein CLAFUR0_03970 [Fulvia fulva]|nr:hypothetical protein CLAFUR0_03970 [Fulvia fulva]
MLQCPEDNSTGYKSTRFVPHICFTPQPKPPEHPSTQLIRHQNFIMVAFKNIALFAVSATALVFPRNAATVQADLNKINSDTQTLTQRANSYNGGLINALPVQNAEGTLENDIKSATSDAQASGPVSDADAQSIIDYINNTLEPSISSAVTAIVNKKAKFQADGLSSIVQKDFNNLKTETDDFGSALLAKAPSDKQAAGQAALSKVDADLQRGINAFA